MGTKTPQDPTSAQSVSEALKEAERDHWLDCPDADMGTRSAAFLLDVIFFALSSSGIHQVTSAILSFYSPFSLTMQAGPFYWSPSGVFYFSWVIRLTVGLSYFTLPVSLWGGTPAKLILGLRVVDTKTGGTLSIVRTFLRECLLKPTLGWLILITFSSIASGRTRPLYDRLARSTVKKVHG